MLELICFLGARISTHKRKMHPSLPPLSNFFPLRVAAKRKATDTSVRVISLGTVSIYLKYIHIVVQS